MTHDLKRQIIGQDVQQTKQNISFSKLILSSLCVNSLALSNLADDDGKVTAYQFFSVRMVCDSWQRGMARIWLRSLKTMVEKEGCPL